jgi:hypothetical protein
LSLWLLDASVLPASEDLDDIHHGDANQLLEGGGPLATLDLAFYEVTNVAIRSWLDHSAAHRLHERIAAVADDGGLVRVEVSLIAHADHRQRARYFGVRRGIRCGSSSFERLTREL